MSDAEIISRIEKNRGNIHSGRQDAQSVLNELIAEYADNPSECVQLALTINRALALHHLQSNNVLAIQISRDALTKYTNSGCHIPLARLMWICGHCLAFTGHYAEAHEWLTRSIDEADKEISDVKKVQHIHADALHDLAMLTAFSGGAQEKIRAYLTDASEIFKQIDMVEGIGICVMGIGNTYYEEGRVDEALENYTLAAAMFENCEVPSNLASAYSNIGNCFVSTKQYEKAEEYLAKALQIREQIGSKSEVAISYHTLAELHRSKGEPEIAIQWFLKCKDIFEDSDSQLHFPSTLYALADLYEQTGNCVQAAAHYKKYIDLQRSQHTREKEDAIAQAEAKFEVAQKDKESALLREKNKQIEQYAHLLEISNNELRQFAHVASHDLKEPLRMVSSYMGLLEKRIATKLSAEENQFLQYALEGSLRMENLINDLLSLSRINAINKKEKVNLNVVMQEVLLNFQDNTTAQRASIEVSALPTILADKTHMQQLFQNLISNALKYNRNDVPVVKVTAENVDNLVCINVADNGIGISERFHKQIFEIFKRLHTRAEFSGTGIGLTICKKIVDQLNGQIQVQSVEGKGTTFTIQFPVEIVVA